MTTDAQRRAARPAGLLIAVLLGLGLWIDLAVLELPQAGDLDFGTAFVLATAAFAIGEAVVLHVELGKNTHTVSLAELALVVSLFFVPATQLTLARLIGGCLVLVLVRRQRPLKIAFNSALWLLDAAVATLVFQQLGGSLHGGTYELVVPALAAALTAAMLDSLAVNAVIAVTSQEIDLGRSLHFVTTCLLGAAACATAALVCVGAVAYEPWLLLPIGLVVAAYLRGFHRFAQLRAQHSDVKVLYDFAGELGRTPHGDRVVSTVLSRVAQVLRAERAALYLLDDESDGFLVTELGPSDLTSTEVVARRDVPALLSGTLGRHEAVVLRASSRHPAARRFLTEYGAQDAVIAPLNGEQGLQGALVIADRLGEVNTFSDDDGLLLQTLASHAAAALGNSRLLDRLDHQSMHDSLTGLANRSRFQERLSRALAGKQSVAVLLMDLDRFKEVNDTLGHHHGDLLLQEIGQRLHLGVRADDVLARLGGDEFAVLMTDLTEAHVMETAQRLLAVLSRPMYLQGVEMEVTASIGVVHVGSSPAARQGVDASQLMQRADVAMYCAKQQCTGTHLYQDELDGYSPRRLALAGGLRSAIEQGQLGLRFQVQSRLADGAFIGAEALVTWHHPLYGTVPPDDFIAIAEQTGQIRELTRYVLDRSLAACATWRRLGMPLVVSVNVSVRNLMEPDLVDAVASLLARHGLPGDQLTLEITESHLMSDPARTAEVLRGLARLGVRLSIDDFGTGYSSLAYLKQLPVTEIKVDKSFVRDIAEDDEDAAIVEAIIQLAHTLRLEVVAEGVEEQAAQDRLAAMGCDLFQGYHLGRPQPEAEFLAWLEARAPRRPVLRALPGPRDGTERAVVGLP